MIIANKKTWILWLTIVVIVAGFVAVGLNAYLKQRTATAMVTCVSEIRFGITTRRAFDDSMGRFAKYKSSATSTACFKDICYAGESFGIDNSLFNRYFVFPETNLAMGVYFDNNDLAQTAIVTVDRLGETSATAEMIPMPSDRESSEDKQDQINDKYIHLYLRRSQGPQLRHVSLACFTRILGCKSAKDLYF